MYKGFWNRQVQTNHWLQSYPQQEAQGQHQPLHDLLQVRQGYLLLITLLLIALLLIPLLLIALLIALFLIALVLIALFLIALFLIALPLLIALLINLLIALHSMPSLISSTST